MSVVHLTRKKLRYKTLKLLLLTRLLNGYFHFFATWPRPKTSRPEIVVQEL
jgi:hypothetical protein